jgi:hypothetical protein
MGNYYTKFQDHIGKIDRGAWVEIGVDRGEGSTQFFSNLAKDHATRFYAVDADIDQINRIQNTLKVDEQIPDHITVLHSTGETFLKEYVQNAQGNKISFVYLDNFDWDYQLNDEGESPGVYQDHKDNYRNKFGLEMTNINSQIAHLQQAICLVSLDLLSDNCVIVCDDTWYMPKEGIYSGKCSAVVPYLLANGFKELNREGFRNNSGCIFGRFKD